MMENVPAPQNLEQLANSRKLAQAEAEIAQRELDCFIELERRQRELVEAFVTLVLEAQVSHHPIPGMLRGWSTVHKNWVEAERDRRQVAIARLRAAAAIFDAMWQEATRSNLGVPSNKIVV